MLPAGHPPIPTADRPGSTPGAAAPAAAAPMAPAEEIEAGQDLPLPLTGPGGADELKRRLEMLGDDATRARVEAAFRQTFTVERDKRDPLGAAKALEGLADDPKAGAVAARIMGYVAVSNGFDVARANAAYRRAIALDPGYGEAHYALAFMLSMNDREAGRVHFDKAMELGVPDIRGIGRFYPKPGSEGASE